MHDNAHHREAKMAGGGGVAARGLLGWSMGMMSGAMIGFVVGLRTGLMIREGPDNAEAAKRSASARPFRGSRPL